MAHLNADLGFDEVRWATMRKGSYDARRSFAGGPVKKLLPAGSKLFRLTHLANGVYFQDVWWMPETAFLELHDDANLARHGGGRLFRNYVAEFLALPNGANQLCFVEIMLTKPVHAWAGRSAPLFGRPGGLEQIYLPNLAERGNPGWSQHARLVHTYWLKF